jgi:RNA recognition motif-containing protein
MGSNEEAMAAISALNETDFQGRTLLVKEARPKGEMSNNKFSNNRGGNNYGNGGGGGRKFDKRGNGGGSNRFDKRSGGGGGRRDW